MSSGDITRSTFRAARHYSGVRMQQGRVQLDADWNEQVDITAHRNQAEALDVIGAAGVPKVDGGFELTVSPDEQDLLLSPGRAWVGGLLCEVDGERTAVADAPTTTSVKVTSLVLDGVQLAADEWVEVLAETESVVTRATAVDASTNTVSLERSIGSLSGDLVLRRRASYSSQPDLPDPEHTTQASAADPRVLDLPEGSYLAYVDAWERSITALDDPTISEPALGVDTATRSKVVWQVRLLDLAGTPDPVDCDTNLSAVLASLAPPTGLMAAQAEPPAGSADLCRPTPAGGYVGLENQLYRVHVHDVVGGRPAILWSRENASVTTAWLSTVSSDILEVSGIGKDAVLGFKPGDWVELYDDTCTLNARPGTLARLVDARDDRLTLDPTTVTGSTAITDFPRNPQIRRWDSSSGPVTVTGDDWLALENGVQVRFPKEGTYRRHDYWLVPARSVLADLDWPTDSAGDALALPPAGIRHAAGRLAIVSRTAEGVSVTDCRDLFPALTALTAGDVTVENDVCNLPGVETVQDAIDALCRANDLRRHNRLLHGYGIVCGLAVQCGDDESTEVRTTRTSPIFSTQERREVFLGRTIKDVPSLGDRLDFDRFDLDDVRARVVRRFVTVQPGSAIDPDGYDLELRDPVVVDVLKELESLGDDVLDKEGDGEVCLVLRNDPDQGPVVAATKYVAREPWQFLEGTLLRDIYDDCIANLYTWVKAQLTPTKDRTADSAARAYLLRTALTNLLTYVANPKSGGNVFVAENEHEELERFYDGLRKRLRSHTFCAMFDDARPYPDYPQEMKGIRTISGSGTHSRIRIHPGGEEAWTTGGGINPFKATTMLNRYSLVEERLVATIDPVSGKELDPGDTGSSTAAAATDVAFSPDGRLVYVAVPTRDGNDTLFRVGELSDKQVRWRPATTICGVKLVTLATTEADPDHVYAVGLRRTSSAGKAFSLREFTGAGIWRIPAKEVPDGLAAIPQTAGLNTVGHLAISPGGEAVFTVGAAGSSAERYERLFSMSLPDLGDVREMQLDDAGSDDLTLVLRTDDVKGTSAWTVTGSGSDRQIVGFDLQSGQQHARIPLTASGRVSLQAVNDRILVTDSNTSAAGVVDCSRQEFLEQLQIPVQVTPMSSTALAAKPRQVAVLNLVSNSITAIDVDIVMADRFDLTPLLAYRRNAVEAFADLVGGLAQYLKDCICDHLLVDCPPELANKDLDLAAVSIRGGSVYKVCNFSRRRYVKSFPTVGYWLSLVPILPAFREAIGRACCTLLPEIFGRYSTAGHDDADDRVDAQRMLRFLETAQNEDPLTRLRSLDWDFLPSFLRGANSGDWSDSTDSSSQPIVVEPTPPPDRGGPVVVGPIRHGEIFEEVHPVIDRGEIVKSGPEPVFDVPVKEELVKPTAPELIFRNVLKNPAISRDLTNEVSAQTIRAVSAMPEGGAGFAPSGVDPGQLEALMARVDSLEAELAAIRKPSTTTARKTTARKTTARKTTAKKTTKPDK